MLNREFLEENPQAFKEAIKDMNLVFKDAKPNDAHYALAQYHIPVITMNVDGLHEKAGSQPINLHGTVPSEYEIKHNLNLENRPVLYGEPAPNYQKGIDLINTMEKDDILLIIGASKYTVIANDIRNLAISKGAHIVEIQDQAERYTRKVIEQILTEKKQP